MTDTLSRRRMIGLTVGSATVALAGCSGGGDESDDDNNVSESAENESGTGSDTEMDRNGSDQDAETAAEEDTGGNETGDDGAAEPEANVVTVGPEESPTMFQPETLTVDSGATVAFEWATATHNIVVESQPAEGNWNGHEEIEDAGYSHEHTFESDGEYEYVCEPHAPDMRGVIVVGQGGTAPENGTGDSTNGTGGSDNGSDTPTTQ